jgi:hypothetical protein
MKQLNKLSYEILNKGPPILGASSLTMDGVLKQCVAPPGAPLPPSPWIGPLDISSFILNFLILSLQFFFGVYFLLFFPFSKSKQF